MATAAPASGTSYLVPLSFPWDGATVVIEGTVQAVTAPASIPAGIGGAFAGKAGSGPRELTGRDACFDIGPQRLRAWREASDLADRTRMSGGDWVTS